MAFLSKAVGALSVKNDSQSFNIQQLLISYPYLLGTYDGVKATSILSILCLVAHICVIGAFKFVLKKNAFIPSIIIGALSGIFHFSMFNLKSLESLRLGADFRGSST